MAPPQTVTPRQKNGHFDTNSNLSNLSKYAIRLMERA